MNKFIIKRVFLICMISIFMSGCSLYRKVIIKSQENLAESAVKVFLEESDYEFARDSAAASLKTLEALAESSPESIKIRALIARAFFMYTFAFIEENSNERASQFYLRGMDWGIKDLKGEDLFFNFDDQAFFAFFSVLRDEELDAAFWSLLNFSCWLNINTSSLKAITNKSKLKIATDILVNKKYEKHYGMVYLLKALDEVSTPKTLGGDFLKANKYFKKSLEISAGNYMPIKYLYAKYYTVAIQDASLFKEQLKDIINYDLNQFPEEKLTNTLMMQRARVLLAKEDELFF